MSTSENIPTMKLLSLTSVKTRGCFGMDWILGCVDARRPVAAEV